MLSWCDRFANITYEIQLIPERHNGVQQVKSTAANVI